MTASMSHVRAIGYSLSGFILWSIGDALIKTAGETGVPSTQIVGFGTLGAAFVIAFSTFIRRRGRDLIPARPMLQFFASLLELGAYFATVVALTNLPLTTFYVVIFMAPMTIALLAAIFLHEPISLRQAIAILAGFCGVLIAINPFAADTSAHAIGYIAVFSSLILFSICMTVLRAVGKTATSESTAFMMQVVMAVVGVSLSLWHFVPMDMKQWIYVLGTSFTGGIAWLLMAAAYKHAPAATVAPFHYSQIIMGAILGYLFWHDVPTLHLIFGVAIIIVSGLYIAAHARKAENIAAVGQH